MKLVFDDNVSIVEFRALLKHLNNDWAKAELSLMIMGYLLFEIRRLSSNNCNQSRNSRIYCQCLFVIAKFFSVFKSLFSLDCTRNCNGVIEYLRLKASQKYAELPKPVR